MGRMGIVGAREIRCLNGSCGALNRLSDYSIRRVARCGKCHKELPEPASIKWTRAFYIRRKRVGLLALSLMIGLFVWQPWVAHPTTETAKTSKPTSRTMTVDELLRTSPLSVNASKPISRPTPVACFALAEPQDGVYKDRNHSPHVAQFTIRTASGADYFVKLEDAAAGYTEMTFYIRGGSRITEAVPLGNFILKYAAGRPWCGEDELFGPDTVSKQADETFLFESRPTAGGYSISNWTVELILQRDGNLTTHSISRSKF
jgi:hypothetical protein